ncbi:biotin--[acetyl-CoA-carboxylase] ligase [Pelobium manganitolerans]|uniref:Biotin--[acetyl-CoA-carboxylase] ligase n=1 Tax=Pelobium manganitolerans TaxID=1842495 RepID=A0A419S6P9_9SPHI|nr:biotin--[acetyl-CoA-carboxylase] ligase [Pelobium manganitolerans]RKD16994.1 biotin--[acetyl-CoA-carboxylase] ligase [Pelobium manganitolerans]
MQNNIFLTLFVGQSLVKLSSVNSTNTYLKNQLSNSTPPAEGTVIMADHQFAGRGQQGNSWDSEAGKNLTFSILFFPDFLKISQQFLLNIAVSLGINDCLARIIGKQCKIKWPNDIYYQEQKLGGILIENGLSGANLKWSIVGIGLNVNQQNFNGNNGRASSISKILHQNYELPELLGQLCKDIERRYLQLKAGNQELLKAEYQERLFGLNQKRYFKVANQQVEGEILGVDNDGCLLLSQNGKLAKYALKEIAFIFDEQ